MFLVAYAKTESQFSSSEYSFGDHTYLLMRQQNWTLTGASKIFGGASAK